MGVLPESSDRPEAFASILERNPGLNWAAANPEGTLVGALLFGRDGRRAQRGELVTKKHMTICSCRVFARV